MAGLLTDTIRAWAQDGCEPHPCGREVWRYVCAARGVPPPVLPAHGDTKAMAALLRERGGLVAYAGTLMDGLGYERTSSPRRGDVGVVKIRGMGKTCAIFLGRHWMAKGDREAIIVPAIPVAVWRID